jgi:membrane protein implicated in regulation of membrane protease activity
VIDWLARLDPQWLVVAIGLAGVLIGLPLVLAAFKRMRHLQLVRGTLFLLSGGVAVLLAVSAGLVVVNLLTYARLTHEQEAAQVTTRQLGPRQFAVSVRPQGGDERNFELRGDEWQIDARVLKWRAAGSLLGFDTVYRLERLSGRYGDAAMERAAPRTVYSLTAQPGIDFWTLARRYHRYLPLADALYGSAAYVPMADGAQYAVTVSSSGLVVRPANEAARQALGAWK